MLLEEILEVAKSKGLNKEEIDQLINKKLISFIKERRFGDLKYLIEIKGINPKLPKDFVQEAYAYCLENEHISELESLQKITGIKLLESTVHEAYAFCWENNLFSRLGRLYQLKGIKPKLPPDVVQEGYYSCTGHEMHLLEPLQKITGIKILEATVQKRYAFFVEHGQFRNLEGFCRITGIKPNLPEDLVQRGYALCLKEGDIRNLNDLQKIGLAKPSEGTFQEVYAFYLENRRFWLLQCLYGLNRIKPELPEDVVQEAYGYCLKNEQFTDLKQLQEIIGIKPSERAVQEKYALLVREGRFSDVSHLQETTGVKPSKDVCSKLIDYIKSNA